MEKRPAVSGWAVAGITFAGCVLALIGMFQVIAGLTAIFDDEFYVVIALDIWVIWALTRPGAIET